METLLRVSQDLNDYAFALGAMAHHGADNNGHRLARNLAVPMLYPTLKGKYGSAVVYEGNPIAYIKTEFCLDVLGVAKGRSERSLKISGTCSLLSWISRSAAV